MRKRIIKKILMVVVTTILALIYFGIVNKSNAAEVIETWNVSEDDGVSNVIEIRRAHV